MNSNSNIVIIGAGLFGLTTAKQLVLEGHKNITVIDRHMPPVNISRFIGHWCQVLTNVTGS